MTWRRAIEEQRREGTGSWLTCTGCHETEDGYDVGHYPTSRLFQCKVGGGCSECGGLGVIWDSTDWSDFAQWSTERDRHVAAVKIMRRRLAWLLTTVQHDLPCHPGYSDSDGSWDAADLIESVRNLLAESYP
ncbi:MAG: hypothetical protein EOP20_10795 [Hyphomicrobiales bacterium]|nr:MAG: hypothetical protein EOP20_10795 [Hyphomicrobiales bacterium]